MVVLSATKSMSNRLQLHIGVRLSKACTPYRVPLGRMAELAGGSCMSRKGSVVLGAVATLGLTVFASEKPPDAYVKNMKETNVAAQELRKNLDAKDYEAIAKQAATLKTLFDNTLS